MSSIQTHPAHRPLRLVGSLIPLAALGAIAFGGIAHAQSEPMDEAVTVNASTTDLGTFLTG